MSGGHFDYKQYHIDDIIRSIEHELEIQGKEKDRYELYGDEEYYNKHLDEKFYYTYSIEIQEKLKEGLNYLKIAAVYTQRIDYLLSGDDGEEQFIKRLSDELNRLRK